MPFVRYKVSVQIQFLYTNNKNLKMKQNTFITVPKNHKKFKSTSNKRCVRPHKTMEYY